ncbi:MAG: hypothetical protein HQ530_05675 [Parcubacteria group bacterium]|nr:hypothetical protein [Parcubacteria group bacterium]
MISEEQLQANRENAKKGGVKTEEGKAASKYNATKHGLLSEEVLLEGENEEALTEIGRKLRTELNPQTELELVLVDRIISNVWRLKRAIRIEAEMAASGCKKCFGEKKSLGEAFAYDLANYDSYGKLLRYETSIERGIYKALHELQRIQAARVGEKPLAPVAVDIDIASDK